MSRSIFNTGARTAQVQFPDVMPVANSEEASEAAFDDGWILMETVRLASFSCQQVPSTCYRYGRLVLFAIVRM